MDKPPPLPLIILEPQVTHTDPERGTKHFGSLFGGALYAACGLRALKWLQTEVETLAEAGAAVTCIGCREKIARAVQTAQERGQA